MKERVLRTEIKHVELAFLEEGSGTPVLLLHGFPNTARTWTRALSFLVAQNFRAVALSNEVITPRQFRSTEIIRRDPIAGAAPDHGGAGHGGQRELVRTYGAREIGSGLLSLSIDKQIGLWSRVAGDALAIATVTNAMRSGN